MTHQLVTASLSHFNTNSQTKQCHLIWNYPVCNAGQFLLQQGLTNLSIKALHSNHECHHKNENT